MWRYPCSPPLFKNDANAEKPGVAVERRERAKTEKQRARIAPVLFSPFGVSLYGAPGPCARSLTEQLCVRISRLLDLDNSYVTQVIWNRISCALMSSIATTLNVRMERMRSDITLADVIPDGFFDA